jgi:DNA-binding HxlR family transcriptional regulator
MINMEPKEVILRLLDNKELCGILMELYEGRKSFSDLKEEAEIKNNTTLTRHLDFLDRAGMIVNIFERSEDGSYSHYELNSYGKRVAEIVIEIGQEITDRITEIPV